MSLRHYLIVFDHSKGRLLSSDEFEDAAEAVAAYAATERQHEGREGMEIVLIGSDSLDTVKKTHANYFDPASGSRFLRGL